MLGSGIIGILKTGERIVHVPESWMDQFGWSWGDEIRIAAGKKSIVATIQGYAREHLSVSRDIMWDLKLTRVPITWKVKKNVIRLGPFVAVYCNHTGNSEKPFASITTLLQDMTKIAKVLNIPFYVISTGGFHHEKKTVTSWIYDDSTGKWLQVEHPWPDFCMKKNISIPLKWKLIAKRESQWMRISQCGMLYRPIGSKLDVYHILSKNHAIVPHLPQTRKIRSVQDVTFMLKFFPVLYIKPSRGTQGRSVYRFSRYEDPRKVRVQFRQGNRTRFVTIKLTDHTTWFHKKFLSHQEFLVQQGINLTTDREGRSADFRWLLQKDGFGEWNVTARVTRLGQKGSVTTNVSTGADVLHVDDFLEQAGFSIHKISSLILEIDDLAFKIVKQLEQHAGSMGELGIDFGLDRDGHPWLIEVNPNPGRKMLKILDPKVRALSLRRPLEYARYTAGFSDVTPDKILKR